MEFWAKGKPTRGRGALCNLWTRAVPSPSWRFTLCNPFPLSPSPPAKTIKTIEHTFTLWFICFYRVVLNKVIENRTNRIIKFLGLRNTTLNVVFSVNIPPLFILRWSKNPLTPFVYFRFMDSFFEENRIGAIHFFRFTELISHVLFYLFSCELRLSIC